MFDREPGFLRPEEVPTGRRVDAKVKWFNATKGFGFVTLAEGSQDAFLPMAILRRAGYDDVREGASITCEVGTGAKGPLVLNVLNIDNSTASAGGERRAPRPASTLDGAVKWFVPDKGYGFIAPEDGGSDSFVHISAVERAGMATLNKDQRLSYEVETDRRGKQSAVNLQSA